MADDAPTLEPGLRFGKDSLIARLRARLRRPVPVVQPAVTWTLQRHDGAWVLLLSSHEPPDLDLPRGYSTRDVAPNDAGGALAWARSVLPDDTIHTITPA